MNNELRITSGHELDEDALDHVLLYGPPGLGKTTLAQIIANELGVSILTSSGPALEHKGELTAILSELEQREVLFVDEIHRLLPTLEEILYPAMEDYCVDLIVGQGPGARIHNMRLKQFTLIGATTRAGLVTAPLRSRFGIVHRLEFYTPEELVEIVSRSAKILNIAVDDDGAFEIARRSRGTPRVANRLLRRARDFAQVRAQGHVTVQVAREALEMLGVDEQGLDEVDRMPLYREHRTLLRNGQWRRVVEELSDLADDDPGNEKMRTEVAYLRKHGEAGRLSYAHYRGVGLPLGSGAIESSIRRVINLRLKSNGMFWGEPQAEMMLQVRAQVISKRWDQRMQEMRELSRHDCRTNWQWEPRAMSSKSESTTDPPA